MTAPRKHGQAAPLSTDPLPCYPDAPAHACCSCARRRVGEPLPVSQRSWPVIDASRFRVDGECLMRIASVGVPAEASLRVTALERAWRAAA